MQIGGYCFTRRAIVLLLVLLLVAIFLGVKLMGNSDPSAHPTTPVAKTTTNDTTTTVTATAHKKGRLSGLAVYSKCSAVKSRISCHVTRANRLHLTLSATGAAGGAKAYSIRTAKNGRFQVALPVGRYAITIATSEHIASPTARTPITALVKDGHTTSLDRILVS